MVLCSSSPPRGESCANVELCLTFNGHGTLQSDSNQFSFSSLGVGSAAVTDATIQGNQLAITSHSANDFELHIILLDGSRLEARHLHKETFEGEVTCLGLCDIGGKTHAVACLWWNSAVYLDLYSVQDKEHVKLIPIQSCEYASFLHISEHLKGK